MNFQIYNSSDIGAPTLSGVTGSLISVLDAVLVNGYGSFAGAGWTKPLPNTGSYGMYKQGNGSTCSLFIYDSGSSNGAGAEAQATGWDSITLMNDGAVTGSNPFPTYAQLSVGLGGGGGAGAVTIRKSNAKTSNSKEWIIFADSSSMYMFIKTNDFGNGYTGFFFGDFYSLRSGSVDNSRCMIIGRTAASSSLATVEQLPALSGTSLTTARAGHFVAHTYSGGGTSITIGKHGDGVKGNIGGLDGSVPYLNAVDNGVYISPIWLVENSTGTIRGRMRGFYQFCHSTSSLINNQIFSGSTDFPNQTFQVIVPAVPTGSYFMETSDTLETNNP